MDARQLGITTRAVMQRWAMSHDTWMIAQHFGITEAEVTRILAAEQDRKARVKANNIRRREELRQLREHFAATPF
jgi:hypothetical protein